MDDKNEPLPWDYFLTDYEKDLLHLPLKDAMRKYPEINGKQLEADVAAIRASQAGFEQVNGQNCPTVRT